MKSDKGVTYMWRHAWVAPCLNGESVPDFRRIAIDVQTFGQIFVQNIHVVAPIQVVVHKHLPVAGHVIAHMLDPGQTRPGHGLERPDLGVDAGSDVIERSSFVRNCFVCILGL